MNHFFKSTASCINFKIPSVVDKHISTPRNIVPVVSCAPSPLYSYEDDILEALKLLNRDKDGAVSRHDLGSFLKRLGSESLMEEDINVMIEELDFNGKGMIRLEDLANHITSLVSSCGSTDLKDTFKFFDADRDGLISAEELLRVFLKIGDESFTLEDCREMITKVDMDGDGFVCFNEFARMMNLHKISPSSFDYFRVL